MLSSLPAVAGFFPPRPARSGDMVVFCSLADALAKRTGPLQVAFPKERVYPSLLDQVDPVRMLPVAEDAPALFSNDMPLLVMPPSLGWLLKNMDPLRLRCLVGVSPTVDDVRCAHDLKGRLLAYGLAKEQIKLFLWNHGQPGGLALDLIEDEIGLMDAVIPFDPGLVCRAENEACLLQNVNARSGMVTALEKLAVETALWMGRPLSCSSTGLSSREALRELERRVTAVLWSTLDHAPERGHSAPEMEAQIDRALHDALAGSAGGPQEPSDMAALRRRIMDHVTGLGPLEELIRDVSVNEIMVNGPKDIFVERSGVIEKDPAEFDSESQLRTVIDRVVGRMGRRVDLSSPLCDVRLPDGSRVNVVLPPLSLAGPVLTVRRFKTLYQSVEDLIAAGTLTAAQADRLRQAVIERKNILVAGNSGAGKTTLLNVLAGLVPFEERILTLEDAAELQVKRPHVVRLETRPANAEGLGKVTMVDLVTNALRMRPDRLVIGECRGAEVIPMLQAMNTGHDGSMTTIHANSAADALRRLESLVLLHAPEWSIEVVRDQVRAGIDLVVYLKRQGAERKLLEIVDVE